MHLPTSLLLSLALTCGSISAVQAAERLSNSCAATLGQAAASRLAEQCRQVSPATHPPCNVANSCALIRDEIARSCALLSDAEAARQSACGPAPSSAQAAAAVVARYYEALAARDYATAWQLWGDDGQPGTSFARFRQGYAHTRQVTVSLGTPGAVEGAAGLRYTEVPVTIHARLDDGRQQTFTGRYRLKRVADVDGAAAWQRRWHLAGADLRAAP